MWLHLLHRQHPIRTVLLVVALVGLIAACSEWKQRRKR